MLKNNSTSRKYLKSALIEQLSIKLEDEEDDKKTLSMTLKEKNQEYIQDKVNEIKNLKHQRMKEIFERKKKENADGLAKHNRLFSNGCQFSNLFPIAPPPPSFLLNSTKSTSKISTFFPDQKRPASSTNNQTHLKKESKEIIPWRDYPSGQKEAFDNNSVFKKSQREQNFINEEKKQKELKQVDFQNFKNYLKTKFPSNQLYHKPIDQDQLLKKDPISNKSPDILENKKSQVKSSQALPLSINVIPTLSSHIQIPISSPLSLRPTSSRSTLLIRNSPQQNRPISSGSFNKQQSDAVKNKISWKYCHNPRMDFFQFENIDSEVLVVKQKDYQQQPIFRPGSPHSQLFSDKK